MSAIGSIASRGIASSSLSSGKTVATAANCPTCAGSQRGLNPAAGRTTSSYCPTCPGNSSAVYQSSANTSSSSSWNGQNASAQSQTGRVGSPFSNAGGSAYCPTCSNSGAAASYAQNSSAVKYSSSSSLANVANSPKAAVPFR